jgi:quinoprotein glucose dehydrogenase
MTQGRTSSRGVFYWPGDKQNPPALSLTAGRNLITVNANTGDFAWQVPLGITEQLPEAKQHTGRPGLGGPIATAGGLVFIGASGDRRFRAFDSKTGKELWVTKLDASANATPMSYEGKNGKQYVAVVAGTSLMAFALP